MISMKKTQKDSVKATHIHSTRARALIKSAIVSAPTELDEKEVDVLAFRFGLRNGKAISVSRVARSMNLPIKETATIQAEAIEKCILLPMRKLTQDITERITTRLQRNGRYYTSDLSYAKATSKRLSQLAETLQYLQGEIN